MRQYRPAERRQEIVIADVALRRRELSGTQSVFGVRTFSSAFKSDAVLQIDRLGICV